PSKLQGASIAAQEHKHAIYSIISSGLPPHVAEREEKKLEHALRDFKVKGASHTSHAACAGNAVTVWSNHMGASSLGESGKPAEKVAGEAADALLAEIATGAAVDSHLADQLFIYAALAEGKSAFTTNKFTAHLTTNAEVLRLLTGRNIILRDDREVLVE
ncbi:MAG: hypothetical protein NTV88_00210, partial [Candidatus Micrarchaeota archaeon]|nr:hypothetical protein [Candidatus Micrarchaeota archaeon]